MAIDLLTAIGVGGASGLSSGALLMFILKSLEKRVTANEKKITNLSKTMYSLMDEQEDCWEEEIKIVQNQIFDANKKLDRVITVMQMQATNSGHPELVNILKGGEV